MCYGSILLEQAHGSAKDRELARFIKEMVQTQPDIGLSVALDATAGGHLWRLPGRTPLEIAGAQRVGETSKVEAQEVFVVLSGRQRSGDETALAPHPASAHQHGTRCSLSRLAGRRFPPSMLRRGPPTTTYPATPETKRRPGPQQGFQVVP